MQATVILGFLTLRAEIRQIILQTGMFIHGSWKSTYISIALLTIRLDKSLPTFTD
ncbi:MAG TPA: hypothetical protein VF700_03695 [Segetibacter sp.]